MANNKCKHCDCEAVEEDPSHGYTVCTNCGVVLEDSSIVNEIQFEENAQGGSSTIGQFVSSESRGGASGFGGSYPAGILGKDSREITFQRAKKEITRLAQLLRLGQTSIGAACNLYKLALQNNLTRGRRNTHVVTACLYMNCRLEGTSHLLIDFSEALQICVFSLGRTFLRLSDALNISLPFMDPCIYVLRYASQLDFGKKTHAVSMTALRLVGRMKRDNIHTGRRPSGLCGAALLIAARLHDFNRSANDIIKIVKVHESTLRKRLMEFGSTPSSLLSLNDFMTIDLEEEEDPPSYTAARLKDKERLEKVMEDEEEYMNNFTKLQQEIDKQLEEKSRKGKRKRCASVLGNPETELHGEAQLLGNCIRESTLGAISECLSTSEEIPAENADISDISVPEGLGPTLATLGLVNSTQTAEKTDSARNQVFDPTSSITLDDLNEDEIDSYIMSEEEVKYKDSLWNQVNATYLREQKEKEEKLAREKAEGKPEKKKRRTKKSKEWVEASTPGEAIERMLKEKKISSKINYEVLKSLTLDEPSTADNPRPSTSSATVGSLNTRLSSKPKVLSQPMLRKATASLGAPMPLTAKTSRYTPNLASGMKKHRTASETLEDESTETAVEQIGKPSDKTDPDNYADDEDDYDDEQRFELEPQSEKHEMSIAEMLNQHREDAYGEDYEEY